MKNKMVDVRNHLCLMLEKLGDDGCTEADIERAKATAQVATVYIGAVKTEIDALRLADEIGRLPVAVSVTDAEPLPRPASNVRVLTGTR